MKNYAEEERILSQPRKMLISSFTLQSGTLITPLLLFYLQLGFVCAERHRCVEYTPNNCFNSLCSQQWRQEGKVTKIQTHVSSQKQ